MQNFPLNAGMKAGVIVGWSLVMGLLFDYFLYDIEPGLSFPLYVLLIIAGLAGLAKLFNQSGNKEVLWLLPPLLFFSGMVFVRASETLTFLNVGASLLLLLLINAVAFREPLKSFQFANYLKVFILPLLFIQPLFETLSKLISVHKSAKNPQVMGQVFKGILITLPILCVFGLLFTQADLVFNKYISDLVDLKIAAETGDRIILIALATLVFIGAYTHSLLGQEAQNVTKGKPISVQLGNIETSIVLGSVNVLFFAFILVQLAYLFGGESTVIAQGFTYAEYARQGFFELIAVAVLSFFLLLAAEKFLVKKNSTHSLGFKILSSALIAQVILIMASAATRLSLYEAAYGLTIMRLFSHAFIFLLAVIFFLLAYKIWKGTQENVFALSLLSSLILFLVTMNILNPEAFIARQNIKQSAHLERFDLEYLESLSDDALPEMIKLLENEGIESLRLAQDANSATSKWQSYNLSRMRAKQLLE